MDAVTRVLQDQTADVKPSGDNKRILKMSFMYLHLLLLTLTELIIYMDNHLLNNVCKITVLMSVGKSFNFSLKYKVDTVNINWCLFIHETFQKNPYLKTIN